MRRSVWATLLVAGLAACGGGDDSDASTDGDEVDEVDATEATEATEAAGEGNTCELLSPDVLSGIGADTEGVSPAEILAGPDSCRWGDRYESDVYVELDLFEPPDRDVFLVRYDSHEQIEGREWHRSQRAHNCSLAVELDDRFLMVDVTFSREEDTTCDAADTLAEEALAQLE